MAETVQVRCESGQVITHDLPLPDGLRQRVAKGEAAILDESGEALPPPPAPAKAARRRVKRN